MKVHPTLKKRSITTLRLFNVASRSTTPSSKQKLKRLPHMFTKVLELPFHSNADVSVEETAECFRFTVAAHDMKECVRAETVEIYSGVSKLVVRGRDGADLRMKESLDHHHGELDLWRFRLPDSTRPEMATAVCRDGKLVVTVPKGPNLEVLDDMQETEEEEQKENVRLILVE